MGKLHFQERVTVFSNRIAVCVSQTVTKVECFEFFPVCFYGANAALFSDAVVDWILAQLQRSKCFRYGHSPFASCSQPLSLILFLSNLALNYGGRGQSVCWGWLCWRPCIPFLWTCFQLHSTTITQQQLYVLRCLLPLLVDLNFPEDCGKIGGRNVFVIWIIQWVHKL